MRNFSFLMTAIFLASCGEPQAGEVPATETPTAAPQSTETPAPEVQSSESQWDTDSEAAKFNTCYDNRAPSDVFAQCGFIERCIEGNNSTSRAMVTCASKGLELWDGKLNSEYIQLSAAVTETFDADASDALRTSQRSWLEYRDNECQAVIARSSFTGAVGAAIKQSCLSDMTAKRAVQFKTENARKT